jgi:hypothetical protein
MDEVVEQLRDLPALRAMTERAYEEIVRSGRYSYRRLVEQFDSIVDTYGKRQGKSGKVRYVLAQLERGCSAGGRYFVGRVPHRKQGGFVERLRRAPRTAMSKGLVGLRLLLRDRSLRRIVAVYLGDRRLWRQIGLSQLLADVLRVGIIQRVLRSKDTGFRLSVRYERLHERLRFESVLLSTEDFGGVAALDGVRSSRGQAPLGEIIWDHSAIGDAVPCLVDGCDHLSAYLGPEGVYDFPALSVLAAGHADVVWRAVLPSVPLNPVKIG